jgi:hypothetical protein
MRRNNSTNVYITTEMIKIYESTKKYKESCEWSKRPHGAVSETRYEGGRK